MSKPTWKMSAVELARVWAEQFGYRGNSGGWIGYDNARGGWVPVAHGWSAFAALLARRNYVAVGQGVDWRRTYLALGETPRLPMHADRI